MSYHSKHGFIYELRMYVSQVMLELALDVTPKEQQGELAATLLPYFEKRLKEYQ